MFTKLYTILCIINRRAELARLVAWADRKRLSGPGSRYAQQLFDQEIQLRRYARCWPRLVKWAHVLHWVSNLISPAPRYYAKGSAAAYRDK